MKIIRNKFGELAGSPIFENSKVIFPSFLNPEIAREGEEWEVELMEEIPLNKVDKKGQPMVKGIYRLLNPVISTVAVGCNGVARVVGSNNYNLIIDAIDIEKKEIKIRGKEYFLPNLYIIYAEPVTSPTQITEEELKGRLQWLTDDEIKEAIESIEFKQMKRYSGSSDECFDPYGRGGKFVANLRVRRLSWLGFENEGVEEETYYEVVSNHPQIYTTTQFEDAIDLEIIKVMSKNEAVTSFELKNYYEKRTAIAPDGKAVEYILIKIKLS